jgi:predicted O-methyltransferase YrrM
MFSPQVHERLPWRKASHLCLGFLRGASRISSDFLRLAREEGFSFALLYTRVQNSVPGWLDEPSARLLYQLARGGPGEGVIVEIGSAWGRSTIYLGRGTRAGRRERVFSIDPHTGDPWYLTGEAKAWFPPRAFGRYSQLIFGMVGQVEHQRSEPFSSLGMFQANMRRFGLSDVVVPLVETSFDVSMKWQEEPIRLLFIDGLHTYEGVSLDIQQWIPRVCSGGIVVFDDYFSAARDVGVRRAVDELLSSGLVEPVLRRANRPCAGQLVWTRKI